MVPSHSQFSQDLQCFLWEGKMQVIFISKYTQRRFVVGLDQKSYETFYLLIQQLMAYRAEVRLLPRRYWKVDFFYQKLYLLSVENTGLSEESTNFSKRVLYT